MEQAVRLSQLTVVADRVYWNEGRPSDGGRQVIVSVAPDQPAADLIPPGFSARSQVHEYGGRCYAVFAGGVVFSNWADQRLWLVPQDGGAPSPLTPEPGEPRAERFADPIVTPDGRWVICVHEHHDANGQVDNDIVAIPLDPPAPDQPPRILQEGHDFYGAPRVSPDGARLAWIAWNHPNMPWDHTELWVAPLTPDGDLREAVRVGDGEGESITQPRWSPTGELHYVSDRTGWWNLYDETGTNLCPRAAEFGVPDWVFGNATYGFLPDGQLVAVWIEAGQHHLGRVTAGQVEPLAAGPFSYFEELQPSQSGGIVALAASPTSPPAVVALDLEGGTEILRRSREVPIAEEDVSSPVAVAFPTGGGETAHAWFYPPGNARFTAPAAELPPVIVIVHGGPTSSTAPVFNLSIQFWTTRGFAVADVDYRGSTGYGTTYRRRLDGNWGMADVEDCARVVEWLAEEGLVDGRRAIIRGGSAGGFTTLAALAFTDGFAAGGSHFGVADLELLARDTHKFESRYLDRLVGPWPETADEYHRRSPIYHVDQITRPLILFQGLEDQVVPPEQSNLMYEALQRQDVPVAYLTFEGEQHGFRQAGTIIAVAQAELQFYGRVFGFAPDLPPGVAPVAIANEGRLSPPA